MQCSVCDAFRAADSFTSSQKKKPAGAWKCSACVAPPAPANVAVAGVGVGVGAGAACNTLSRPAAAVVHRGAAGASPAPSSGTEPRASPPGTPTATMPLPLGNSASAAQAAGATADTDADSSAPPRKFCAWVGCARQLPANAAEHSRCGRCKRALYCDRTCQKRHWSRGGHKEACVEPPCCTICLGGGDDPVPIQRGCACRGDAGLAHVACLAEAAARQQTGFHDGWETCPTCGQKYTGAMALGLARRAMSKMRTRRRGDTHRLAAANNLGEVLRSVGMFAEAASVLTDVLAVAKRVCGKEHRNTITAAANLANTYDAQGKGAGGEGKAEELKVWVLETSRRVFGKEHVATLAATTNLANTYRDQGRLAEAEELLAKALEVRLRVCGAEHTDTLAATANLAATYRDQGKLDEAAALLKKALATSRRVLGARHPDTRRAASNLAATYVKMGKGAEAARLCALLS